MLLKGDGLDLDEQLAYQWFNRAVELEDHGSDDARYYLGLCQYFGWGAMKTTTQLTVTLQRLLTQARSHLYGRTIITWSR